MIKVKKKICKSCSNERVIFSKGRCRSCAQKEDYKPIKKQSEKRRTNGDVLYLQARKELKQEWLGKGWTTCLFSGEPLSGKWECHHLLRRDGELLYDKKYLSFVRRKYHNMWDDMPIKKLMEQEWWGGFQARLKERCPDAYEHVMNEIENRLSRS